MFHLDGKLSFQVHSNRDVNCTGWGWRWSWGGDGNWKKYRLMVDDWFLVMYYRWWLLMNYRDRFGNVRDDWFRVDWFYWYRFTRGARVYRFNRFDRCRRLYGEMLFRLWTD